MTRPVRHIGLMGTHGTGKSTFARQHYNSLVESFPHETISIITGIARQCPLPVNKNTSEAAQLWIFSHHLQAEIEAKYVAKYSYIICDRTILDSLAYAQAAGLTDVVDACFPMALHWLEQYSSIILFPPAPSWLQEDGFRDTDPVFQAEIHAILIDWVQCHHIPVKVRGDENGIVQGIHRRQMAGIDDHPPAH